MKEHLKLMIWPHGAKEAETTDGHKVKPYRYVVVGCLATEFPIDGLEGKNEVVIEGNIGLADILANAPQRPPSDRWSGGSADSVITGLSEI